MGWGVNEENKLDMAEYGCISLHVLVICYCKTNDPKPCGLKQRQSFNFSWIYLLRQVWWDACFHAAPVSLKCSKPETLFLPCLLTDAICWLGPCVDVPLGLEHCDLGTWLLGFLQHTDRVLQLSIPGGNCISLCGLTRTPSTHFCHIFFIKR